MSTDLRSPNQIARETVARLAAPDAQRLTGTNAISIAASAVRADRQQLRTSGMLSRFVEAYEAYDGDDVGQFVHDWAGYFAGEDEPCPNKDDGLHQVTSGSCDMCGSKNRN